MGSSDRLLDRKRNVYETFGGDFVVDVILWREKNVAVGIWRVALASWVVFESSSYPLLLLISSVPLLVAILFIWTKYDAIHYG